jgi:hypothetical protein
MKNGEKVGNHQEEAGPRREKWLIEIERRETKTGGALEHPSESNLLLSLVSIWLNGERKLSDQLRKKGKKENNGIR